MVTSSLKKLLMCVAVILGCVTVASAEPVLNAKVTTDKSVYAVGDTVHWTIYAWGNSGETHGLAFLDFNLICDNGSGVGSLESMQPAVTTGSGTHVQFLNTYYTDLKDYSLDGDGAGTPGIAPAGTLYDMHARQVDNLTLDVGSDGIQHEFAEGAFVITHTGSYTMEVEMSAANYWQLNPQHGNYGPLGFVAGSVQTTSINVTAAPEPATITLVGIAGACLLRLRRRVR